MRPSPKRNLGTILRHHSFGEGGKWFTSQATEGEFSGGIEATANLVLVWNVWFPTVIRIDRVAFKASQWDDSAGTHGRLAIYRNKKGDVWPDTLAWTGDNQDLSTWGEKESECNFIFHPDKIYWMAFCADAIVGVQATDIYTRWGSFMGYTTMSYTSEVQTGGVFGISGAKYTIGSYANFPEATFPAIGSCTLLYDNANDYCNVVDVWMRKL